ncbi:ATP-binding protein [Planotetraspora kaengkrachanensis]|uniref:NTPase n=1 Tax=Planotetraspora kaengkrachanensis TaxID=575193 RepID=A0A8J3PXY6_9ACTN|nr:NB-ARC domain-containing protein [Planotetraspora kaengkrachanensis]GIG82938.1 NTPase [Planotetraspora kaengkrachanensis]
MGSSPLTARAVAEFVALLDDLRQDADLSFRQLEENARLNGGWLPRATANDVVKRRNLPARLDAREFISSWVGACGGDVAEWLRAWENLPVEHQGAFGPGPRQLPAETSVFEGRVNAMKSLDEAVRGPSPALIVGPAGVGKTALAIHWAHQREKWFSDGQLYLNLRGFAQEPPLTPDQAVRTLLLALSVPARTIPEDLEGCAALLRSNLSGRRILLVFDNAADVAQVRPLLPGSSTCGVIVTSRIRLTGLVAREGARLVDVGPLSTVEGQAVLRGVLGTDRTASEREAIAELAELCGGLPLALRICAANLVALPYQTLTNYAALLRDGDRIAALGVDGDDDAAVRAAFELSYSRLPADVSRLFRLLGAMPGADITVSAAATMSGLSQSAAGRLLQALENAHLVERRALDRYGMHDLIRLYARALSEDEDPDSERDAAIRRLADWHLAGLGAVADHLRPDFRSATAEFDGPQLSFPTSDEALAWLRAELMNLRALGEHMARANATLEVCSLLDAARVGVTIYGFNGDMTALGLAALDMGKRMSDPGAIARAHCFIAAFVHDNHYSQGLEHGTRAVRLFREIGEPHRELRTRNNLAEVHRRLGNLRLAEEHMSQALGLASDDYGVWPLLLANLADILIEDGRHVDALRIASESVVRARSTVGTTGLEVALNMVATAQLALGDLDEATGNYDEARQRSESIGWLDGVILAVTGVGRIASLRGDHHDAIMHLQSAITQAGRGWSFYEGKARTALADAYLAAGHPEAAIQAAADAVTTHRDHGERLSEARALRSFGDGLAATGDAEGARERWTEALAILTELELAEAGTVRDRLDDEAAVSRPAARD